MSRPLCALALCLSLAACGQKGPLYMPGHAPKSHRHLGGAPAAPAAPTPTTNTTQGN